MTWILGFKNAGAAHLIADSAITRERPPGLVDWSPPKPLTPYTLFGQEQIWTRDHCIEEFAVKLFIISDDIAVAAAGDMHMLKVILECFKSIPADIRKNDVKKNFALAINNCRTESNQDRSVAFLIAYIDSEGQPKLASCKNDHIEDVDEFEQCGYYDAANLLPALFARDAASKYFSLRNLPSRATLRALVGLFNGFSILDEPLRSGVGGYFFGLSVTNAGIFWQGSTRVSEVNDLGEPNGFAYLTEKNNSIIGISNIKMQTRRFYPDPLDVNTGENQMSHFMAEAHQEIKSNILDCVISVNKTQRKITVIDPMVGKSPHYYLNIVSMDGVTKFQSRYSDSLKKWFTHTEPLKPGRLIPYDFCMVESGIDPIRLFIGDRNIVGNVGDAQLSS